MKTLKIFLLILICNLSFTASNHLLAQCQPMIIIDGNNIVADENASSGLKLPAWLKTGQTLNIGQYVYSISVIEFTVNGTTLDYSQNLNVTGSSTVPASKVWKIEAVNKNATLPSFSGSYTYSTAGSYTFTAPPCISTARVQVWAGGGGGGSYDGGWTAAGGGGGAGGYAEGFYQLTSSGSYTITVGAGGTAGSGSAGGNGGTSSVGTISISATGGTGGGKPAGGGGGTGVGGAGGTGSGQLNFSGGTGASTTTNTGGRGGDAPNGGGAGGVTTATVIGVAGTSPGGGGSGGWGNTGGAGATGKVIITFGASTSTSSSTTIVPGSGSLQFSQAILVNTTLQTVPSGKVWEIKSFLPYNDNQYAYVTGTPSYGCTTTGSLSYFKINGNNYPATLVGDGNASYFSYQQVFPIWIPAGTTVQSGCANALVSVVEWTVVP